MKLKCLAIAILFASSTFLFAAGNDATEKFTVSQPTMVPGLTLEPGTYSIGVVTETDGRYILRVEGEGGAPHAIFVAVPLRSLPAPGALRWDKGSAGTAALRGFAFRGGARAVEFAYPKDDAVALARSNHQPVLAVDPASEGRSPELSSLTNDEIQAVTLWTLTPEPVAPDSDAEPKIAAARYQIGDQVSPVVPPAAARGRGALKVLPHTAGIMYLLLMVGLLAAAGGSMFSVRRWKASRG